MLFDLVCLKEFVLEYGYWMQYCLVYLTVFGLASGLASGYSMQYCLVYLTGFG